MAVETRRRPQTTATDRSNGPDDSGSSSFVRRYWKVAVYLLVLASIPTGAILWSTGHPPEEPPPSAEERLRQVSNFYRLKKSFACNVLINASTTDTRREPLNCERHVIFKRPDRYCIRIVEGMELHELYSDGQTTTAYWPRAFGAQQGTPALLPQLLDNPIHGNVTGDIFNHLFSADPEAALLKGVTESSFIAHEKLLDRDVDRFRFKCAKHSFDLWIDAGNEPLVRQIEFDVSPLLAKTGRAAIYDNGYPAPVVKYVEQYRDWKFDEEYPIKTFQYTPPKRAHPWRYLRRRIDIFDRPKLRVPFDIRYEKPWAFHHMKHVVVPSAAGLIDPNDEFCVELWVQFLKDAPTHRMHAFAGDMTDKPHAGWMFRATGDETGYHLDGLLALEGTTRQWMPLSEKLQWDTDWHHIALCLKQRTATLFRDGKQIGTGTLDRPFGVSKGTLFVGPPQGAYSYTLSANIRSFRLSKAARYNGDYAVPQTLEADEDALVVFDFESAEGLEIVDQSPNHHDGDIGVVSGW